MNSFIEYRELTGDEDLRLKIEDLRFKIEDWRLILSFLLAST
jgi:hypothetical protein